MSTGVSWCFEPSQPQRITSGLGYRCLFGLNGLYTWEGGVLFRGEAWLESQPRPFVCTQVGCVHAPLSSCHSHPVITTAPSGTNSSKWLCLMFVYVSLVLHKFAGIACWLERRTRHRKVASSNPGGSGGRIFFSRVNFAC